MFLKLNRQHLSKIYTSGVIILGGLIIVDSIYQLFRFKFEWSIFVFAAFTTVTVSQINIKIRRFNNTITLSDGFTFLALLLWNAPAAILAAAVASVMASRKEASRRFSVYLFNAAAQAAAVWAAASILQTFYGEPTSVARQLPILSFIAALGLTALTQYFVQSIIILISNVLETVKSALFKKCHFGRMLSFFVGAAIAGLIIYFADELSLLSLAIIAPFMTLAYFTHRTYLQSLEALQESEARFRSSFDYATVGMALVSPEGKWLQVNQSLCKLLGKTEAELLDSTYQETIHDTEVLTLEIKINQILNGNAPTCQMEVRFVRPDNNDVWALLSASTARDAHNKIRHLIFQTQDITLRKNVEEKLLYDASHDALTELPNRASYTRQLETALELTKQHPEKMLAVLFLDLDGFKLVNDSLGHVIGDELLKVIAGRLLDCVRETDTVARLGGDEFTILLEDLQDVSQAVGIAERIRETLAEPFQLGGQEIFVGTSIGIATTMIEYKNSGEILRDADAAMYQAKARGKGCHVVFDQQMFANATRQLRLANDLRRAIERRELVAHYQAVQCLETSEICGFEALVRWHHPVYGVLMPSEFIPLAEENGLINSIDNWTLGEACRQMRQWQIENAAFTELTISVNVSTKQFGQAGLVENVRQVLDETGLAARNLQLEITESAMVKNLKNTARILRELTSLGVVIALDDFGTGYSSLSYLHEFPISTLKIDRSFVARLNDENGGAEIVRAIVGLARNLSLKVVAEGVETLEQLKQLREMGCDYGQGYLFSRPLSAAEAVKLHILSQQKHVQGSNLQHARLRLVSGA